MLKRLIEVSLPLKEVSEQSAREKSIRHGHISTLHIWWARRPLAACRAVVFASLIPDPDDPECSRPFPHAGDGDSEPDRIQTEERGWLDSRRYTADPLPGVHKATREVGELEQPDVYRTGPRADCRRPQVPASRRRRRCTPKSLIRSRAVGQFHWKPFALVARPMPLTSTPSLT